MRKTSFFYHNLQKKKPAARTGGYSLKFTLLVLLAWILLLDEAVRLNMSQGEDRTAQEAFEIVNEETAQEARKIVAEETPQEESEDAVGAVQQEDAETDAAKTSDAEQEAAAEAQQEQMIRVLLMDTGYRSYFHPSVTVVYDDEEVTYTAADLEQTDTPLILPQQEDGILVTSIERQQGNPSYQGSLELWGTEQGILLINELALETYLEAVVPSEMPSSYEEEALKAQAICARTYACRQMQEERLEEYGADVDDSVNFQVYGNIAPQDSTTAAVKATAGQVLCQAGELVQAYYFSTSAGATSTDEIWGAEQAASYLKAVSCEFDQEEPWSSWNVTIPWSTLDARSCGYISGETDAAPESSGSVSGLKSLEITRKNQSGAVTGLHVTTEAGSFDLTEEYAIRQFLSPAGCMITEKDGTLTEGGALLPSAYFTMETDPGENVSIRGGGFGHGVGMSQTAANEMAARGYTCSEILDYFFQNVTICSVEELQES